MVDWAVERNLGLAVLRSAFLHDFVLVVQSLLQRQAMAAICAGARARLANRGSGTRCATSRPTLSAQPSLPVQFSERGVHPGPGRQSVSRHAHAGAIGGTAESRPQER